LLLTVLIFSQTRIKTKAKVKGKRTRINKNATEAKRSNKNKQKCNRGQEECEHLLPSLLSFHLLPSHLLLSWPKPTLAFA
jgi:hypothetical protein